MTSNSIYAFFKSNKYTLTYLRIIENRKTNPLPKDVYSEKHHIIPKCMGGNNDKENLIKISGREHFILHWLLTKMVDGHYRYKMLEAFSIFSNNKNRNIRFTSRQIESMRKANAAASSERNKGNASWKFRKVDSVETRKLKSQSSSKSRWVNNGIEESFVQSHVEMVESKSWSYGRIKSDKIKKPRPPTSEETKRKLSITSKKALTGVKKSKEHCEALSKSQKNQEKIKCEFCNGIFGKRNFKASHGPHCKHNPNRSQISIDRSIVKSIKHKERWKNNSLPEQTCPHCQYQSNSLGNMKRWHFDKCKMKKDSKSPVVLSVPPSDVLPI